jgi:hypothetical protein
VNNGLLSNAFFALENQRESIMKIRAHFDGKVIVPDESVDLPVGQQLEIEVSRIRNREDHSTRPEIPDVDERRSKMEAYEYFRDHAIEGVVIPDEALRRENLYSDFARYTEITCLAPADV